MTLERRLKALEKMVRPSLPRDDVPLTEAENKAFRLAEAVCVAFYFGNPELSGLARLYSGISAANASGDQCQPYRQTLKGRLSWAVYKLHHPTPGKYRPLAECVRDMTDVDYDAINIALAEQIGLHHPELFTLDVDKSWTFEATADGRIIGNHKNPETAYEVSGALVWAFGPQRAGKVLPC